MTESLFVKASPEALWDWTQDWSRRREWDRSIRDAEIVNAGAAGAAGAAPRVRIRAAGGVTAVIHYKEFLRPRQTSVVMEEVQSWLLEGGGGAWSYVPRDGGTEWTQTNSLVVKPGWWRRLLVPMVASNLRTATRAAMHAAREAVEGRAGGGAA